MKLLHNPNKPSKSLIANRDFEDISVLATKLGAEITLFCINDRIDYVDSDKIDGLKQTLERSLKKIEVNR